MKLIIVLSIAVSFVCNGQSDEIDAGNRIKVLRDLYIGVSFSPDFCYRYITKNNDQISDSLWKHIETLEDSIYRASFGYTTGVNLYYQFKKRFSLESGIVYSRLGYQTIPMFTVYDFDKDPEIATNFIRFNYLNLPLRANFTFLKSRMRITASAGVVFSYLLAVYAKSVPENPTFFFPEQNQKLTYPYNKFNIFSTVSVGVKYPFNVRMILRAEPIFRFGFLNIDKESYKFTHLWSLGLNTSLIYRL